MNQPNIALYCDLMMEIRFRADSIVKLQKPIPEMIPDFVRVECLILQVRKILELIALGSMVLNKSKYMKAYEGFERHWHADRILKDIARVNPDFYPRPAKQTTTEIEGLNHHHLTFIEETDSSYLWKKDFGKVYEKCAGLLHAQNPFGTTRDYAYYERSVGNWMTKIEALLSIHVIRLVDDENFYLVHMKAQGGKPHGYTISPAN